MGLLGGVTGAWGRWAYGPDPRLPPLGTTPPDDTTGGGKRGWVEGKRKEKGGVDPNTPDPRK